MHRRWWTLLAVSVATFMLLLDITVVNTSLPSIAKELGAGFNALQWVVDAYALGLAAVVLTAGSLADRLGRRAVFATGLGLFSLSSLAAGLAPNATIPDVSRAVQGVGGAALFAVSLALVAQEFPAGRARGTATGIYGATIGISVAIGPLVGGAITTAPEHHPPARGAGRARRCGPRPMARARTRDRTRARDRARAARIRRRG